MKIVTSMIYCLCFSSLFGQTWRSIPRISQYTPGEANFALPNSQFEFNPYTNDLWFVSDSRVSILENDGDVKVIDNQEELGSLFGGVNIQFCFTPLHVYYCNNFENLYTFDNYISNAVLSGLTGFDNLASNGDTIYIISDAAGVGMKKYTESGGQIITDHYPSQISAKDSTIYVHHVSSSDQIGYYHGPTWLDFTWIDGGPDYLGGDLNDVKFARYTDTFYVATINGISFAEAYEFVGNYSSSNTNNMPSNNVLEIDFDHNNDLWAVFGDANDDPFAIARLNGSDWVDYIDENNSPIDFTTFYGLAIDTLGNPYFVDGNNLHTIIGPNSPNWLSVDELTSERSIICYPNPMGDVLMVQTGNSESEVILTDVLGNIVKSTKGTNDLQIDVSNLTPGIYTLSVKQGSMRRVQLLIKE